MNVREAGGSGRRTFTFFDLDQDGIQYLLVNSATIINVFRGLGEDVRKLQIGRFDYSF